MGLAKALDKIKEYYDRTAECDAFVFAMCKYFATYILLVAN